MATVASALGAWLELRYGWVATVFDAIAHIFYEVPLLAAIRRPSQLVLVRWHLVIGSVLLIVGLLAAPLLDRHGRNFLAIVGLAYTIRAVIWICGGNLPLVPGDSCHYLEVATSVVRGEGPVKHYVESFFRDYPAILDGKGVLDDWATPLDAYVRAAAFRIAGLGPESPLPTRIGVAKACSFVTNLLCLPALYLFSRRRYGCRVAIWTMAALAILPVHAIYAGFVLRESLVALMSILAVWTLSEVSTPTPAGERFGPGRSRRGYVAAWLFVAHNRACVLAAAALFAIIVHGRRRIGPLMLWGTTTAVVCVPWAWATLNEYGSPFYSYTRYFEYNFSWTVHHYERGNTLASQFYTLNKLPEIVRVKVKSLILIVAYSTMIVGLPVAAGFCWHLGRRKGRDRETDLLVAVIALVFMLATLKSIADVTQVAQLGRYYLPVFALMLPGGIAGLIEVLETPGHASWFPGPSQRIALSSGPIRRGRMMRHGWANAISFTGPHLMKLGSGSSPIRGAVLS